MSDSIQEFVERKENQLETSIRGGLLKQKDAYGTLCRFTDIVRLGIHFLKNDTGLFNDNTPRNMIILFIFTYLILL